MCLSLCVHVADVCVSWSVRNGVRHYKRAQRSTEEQVALSWLLSGCLYYEVAIRFMIDVLSALVAVLARIIFKVTEIYYLRSLITKCSQR